MTTRNWQGMACATVLAALAGCSDNGGSPSGSRTGLVFVSDVVSDMCPLAIRVYDPATRVDYRDALESIEYFPFQYDLDAGAWELEFYENQVGCAQGVLFDQPIALLDGGRRLYVATNRDGAGSEELLSFDVSSLPLDEQALVIVNLSGASATVGPDNDGNGAADAPVEVGSDSHATLLAPRPGLTQNFVASGALGLAQEEVTYSDFYDWDVDYTVCLVVSDRAGGVAIECAVVAREYF